MEERHRQLTFSRWQIGQNTRKEGGEPMTTKTTVAEFRDFYNDETVWANEAWYEDLRVTINGH